MTQNFDIEKIEKEIGGKISDTIYKTIDELPLCHDKKQIKAIFFLNEHYKIIKLSDSKKTKVPEYFCAVYFVHEDKIKKFYLIEG